MIRTKRKKSELTKIKEKCDKAIQVAYMKQYKECEVCDRKAYCLHHFYPKSMSLNLRYDLDNLVPICRGCHMRHHNANDPTIHVSITRQRGYDWYDKLEKKRNKKIKVDKEYYEKKLKELNER